MIALVAAPEYQRRAWGKPGEYVDIATLPRPLIERRALLDVISGGLSDGVVLVSAPPGSGKTTLLKAWMESAGLATRTAWVSVERGERDAQHFWHAVLSGLQTAAAGEAPIEPPAPTPGFQGAVVVEHLERALQSLQEPVILLIDDLHELIAGDALAEFEALLSRRPPRLHVILSTRRDPQLRLHRLRLSGELTEIRDADLRFTLDEARELLATSGIALPPETIALLHARTEGWAAGLRLAALSLTGHPDPARFIADFSGSERTISDYLLAEVLEHQPDDVKEFLLRTSVLEQVNGELADALLGRTGCEYLLQTLEAQNAFVTAVDPSRSWFRYHHLFADLLRLELRRTHPDDVAALHGTAARWYAEHGHIVDAVRHAQRAQDWSYASSLLAEHYFSLLLNGKDATVTALLADFPTSARSDPEFALIFALAQLNRGSLDEGSAYLALAEREADAVCNERRGQFSTALAVARLTLARLRGAFDNVPDDVEPLLSSAKSAQTLKEISQSSDLRALALMNLGIAEKWATRFDEGEGHLLQGLQLARRTGRRYVEVGCLSYLGLHFKKWTNVAGKARCEEALALAESQGWGCEPIAATALVRLFGYAVREGRYDDAARLMERAEKALRVDADPATAVLFNIARGGYYILRGRYELALDAFEAAQRLRNTLAFHHAFSGIAGQHIAMTQVRLRNTAAARATLAGMPQEQQDGAEGRVSLASIELAEGNARAAADALAPILDGSIPTANIFTTAAALLLDAQARDALGERSATHERLEQVLELAEQEDLIPAFAIAPASLRGLLERHVQRGTAHAPAVARIFDRLDGCSGTPPSEADAFPEPLSESELRVLRYLPTNLTGPEIGAEINLSLNTIKTHIREIYAKLGVHSRSEAVERARKRGLTRFG